MGALFPQVEVEGRVGGAALGEVEGGWEVVGRGASVEEEEGGGGAVEGSDEVSGRAAGAAGAGVDPATGGRPAGG